MVASPRSPCPASRGLGTWRIGIAAILIAVAASAGLGYRHGLAEQAERAARLGPQLELWRTSFERDARELAQRRREAERWVGRVSSELSRLQVRIVHLDALARRLAERTDFPDSAFDFSREPGVGGPAAAQEIEAELRPPALRSAVVELAEQIEDRGWQLEILEDMLKWRDLSAAVRPDGRPVRSAYVSSGFGPRIDPFTGGRVAHNGMDFAGRPGAQIVAVAAGIVTWSGPRSGYGKMVEIDHGNGVVTRYAHNAENLVAVGDIVTRGEAIAKLGDTGRATGPNLHFEVLLDGRPVNPRPYVE